MIHFQHYEFSIGAVNRMICWLIGVCIITVVSCKSELPEFVLDSRYDKIESIHSVAQCSGPQGSYVTRVNSFLNGRCEFVQEFENDEPDFAVLIEAGGLAYILDAEGEPADTLEGPFVDVIRSHEFHLLHSNPNKYFDQIEYERSVDKQTDVYAAKDRLTHPVRLYYKKTKKLISKIELQSPIDSTQTIEIIHKEWQDSDYGPMVKILEVVQAAKDTFYFDFHTIDINP